jgi:A/G-specific adenine glycosylase
MNTILLTDFQDAVWRYYDAAGRHNLPWRQPEVDGSFNPYKIMVSELMLQQTQVGRVIPKYLEFLDAFPDIASLTAATLGQVLAVWSGLGYNRRAKFLWQAAQKLVAELNGQLPDTVDRLTTLPGIGSNTAGAIVAYVFDQPVVFIETNVRTVFIAHFFRGAEVVSDKEIARLVLQTLPEEHFREWYWALMDYGTHLKQKEGNLSRLSNHYTRQSAFEGSLRQVRGKILRLLLAGPMTLRELEHDVHDERLKQALAALIDEEMVTGQAEIYRLA